MFEIDQNQKIKEKETPQTIVIISYNRVNGFDNGWHGGNKLFIHANQDGGWGSSTGRGNNDKERAQSVMGSLNHQFYGRFEVPISNVSHFYIYAGLNAMESALAMAKNIKKMVEDTPVTVVACSCDRDEKRRILLGTSIEMISCSCGGQDDLGQLAKKVLES